MESTLGFAVVCKRFFGFKEGQTLAGFAAELKAIPKKDKMELAEMLSKEFNANITLTTTE